MPEKHDQKSDAEEPIVLGVAVPLGFQDIDENDIEALELIRQCANLKFVRCSDPATMEWISKVLAETERPNPEALDDGKTDS